jgi:hypothetical protein
MKQVYKSGYCQHWTTYPDGHWATPLNRAGAPAVIRANGVTEWMRVGVAYRDDGPALIRPDGAMLNRGKRLGPA